MATKKTSTRKNGSGSRRRRPQPDIAQSWSILLFGLGAVLVAMIFVEGESAWAWMRAALFGVFGLGMYVLGLLVLYVAVLVALGLPIWSKCAKALCLMMFLCGTAVVFSRVNLTGMDFGQVVKALYEQGQGALGGGVLGGVVGGTLLVLCGRPAANILLVVLLAAGIMWFAGVTPGDLWNLVAGRYALWQEGRAERAALQEEEREEEPVEPQPRRRERPAPAPKARRRAAQVDIDLGPDPVQETDLAPDPEEPLVGPGGTFGMFPPQDAPQQEKTPYQEDSEFETPIFLEGDEEPASGRPDTKESMPETVGGSDLDDLVQRAMGAASAAQMTPAAVVPGKNDQMMIAPAAAEQQVYHYPPLSLFERTGAAEDPGVEEELKKNAELLVSTLESFGVRTRVLDICRGPSVTRYELQPLAGVKISRITGLADDIALNLAAGGVRIEAPIPGKPAVGVEVPNRKKSPVGIRSIFESPVYSKSASPLTLALGKDIAGNAQIADLCKMPHLLIAGSTGSGKSVCVNSIIISFLYKASPEDVRLILIDPKVVELAEYNGIPHLLMPVVTEHRKAVGALGSDVAEMERR